MFKWKHCICKVFIWCQLFWGVVLSTHLNRSLSCIGGSQYYCGYPGGESCSTTANTTGGAWNYGTEGPYTWWRYYPNCGAMRQSPIDLEKSTWRYMRRLRFQNYDKVPSAMVVTNNGHSLQVSITGVEASISGGPLQSTYILDSILFHWSSGPLGSEHYFKKSYAMEMQFVHYNEIYGNMSNAGPQENGLAIIGVLLYLSEESSSLEPIVAALQNVTRALSETTIDGFSLNNLFMPNNRYYTYQGSHTAPPCYETVTWIIMRETYHLSCSELDEFRTLLQPDGSSVSDNFRPIQPRNDREVYKSI